MRRHSRFGIVWGGEKARSGFSLVETLVAAAVVLFAVVAVVAVVRKGQEQMWVEKHRRTARAIVDTILEAPQYAPANYPSIANGTTNATYTIDTNLSATATTVVSSQNDSGVPHKRIWSKVRWVEPGGMADSVVMERLVPHLQSPVNVAPLATSITASSTFAYCNCDGRGGVPACAGSCPCIGTGTQCSPEVYHTDPWSVVDGIVGTRINGDWSAAAGDVNPWIRLRWATAHRLFKIVLYNRLVPPATPCCYSEGARITLHKSGVQVGTATLSSGFYKGSCNTAYFSPREVDEIYVYPQGSQGYEGFSEIEVYE